MDAAFLKETPTHFHVRMDGKEHKIAKANIKPETEKKIRGFAKGGVVKGYADGGLPGYDDAGRSPRNVSSKPDMFFDPAVENAPNPEIESMGPPSSLATQGPSADLAPQGPPADLAIQPDTKASFLEDQRDKALEAVRKADSKNKPAAVEKLAAAHQAIEDAALAPSAPAQHEESAAESLANMVPVEPIQDSLIPDVAPAPAYSPEALGVGNAPQVPQTPNAHIWAQQNPNNPAAQKYLAAYNVGNLPAAQAALPEVEQAARATSSTIINTDQMGKPNPLSQQQSDVVQQQQQAATRTAAIESQQQQYEAQVTKNLATWEAGRQVQLEKNYDLVQKRALDLADRLNSQAIDPKEFWDGKIVRDPHTGEIQRENQNDPNSPPKRTGGKPWYQKALAGIGMILGGAPAVAIVEKAMNGRIQDSLNNYTGLAKDLPLYEATLRNDAATVTQHMINSAASGSKSQTVLANAQAANAKIAADQGVNQLKLAKDMLSLGTTGGDLSALHTQFANDDTAYFLKTNGTKHLPGGYPKWLTDRGFTVPQIQFMLNQETDLSKQAQPQVKVAAPVQPTTPATIQPPAPAAPTVRRPTASRSVPVTPQPAAPQPATPSALASTEQAFDGYVKADRNLTPTTPNDYATELNNPNKIRDPFVPPDPKGRIAVRPLLDPKFKEPMTAMLEKFQNLGSRIRAFRASADVVEKGTVKSGLAASELGYVDATQQGLRDEYHSLISTASSFNQAANAILAGEAELGTIAPSTSWMANPDAIRRSADDTKKKAFTMLATAYEKATGKQLDAAEMGRVWNKNLKLEEELNAEPPKKMKGLLLPPGYARGGVVKKTLHPLPNGKLRLE